MKLDLYEYQWIDVAHDNEWWDINDVDKKIEEDTKKIISVGFMVKKTDKFYVFCSGYDTGRDNLFDRVTLPVGVVICLKKL